MLDLEKNLIAYPALWRLRALMPRGLNSVRPGVLRSLDDEDYSMALKLANESYARRREQDYDAALTYACLLVGRELVVEARGILMRALETYPLDPALSALLADAMVIEGNIDGAREILAGISGKGAEIKRFSRPNIMSFVADIFLDLGDDELGDVDSAVELYQCALDADVDDPEPAIRLGQLYEGRGELDKAAAALEYAAKLSRTRVGLWQMTAEMWFEVGDELRGLNAKQRLLELGEAGAEEWLELGFEFAQFGRYERALDALDKVGTILHHSIRSPEVDAIYRDSLLVRGGVLLELGRAEVALAVFRDLEERVGEHPGAQRGMAEAALQIGDIMLAETHATRALELSPEDTEVLAVYGQMKQQYGRHADAIDALGKALVEHPDQAGWRSALALSLVKQSEVDQAREALQQAVESAKTYPELLPVAVDIQGWSRLIAQLRAASKEELASWIETQINFLSAPASE
ncbi:tetratricopeptide repeat protein [Bradymonas sediminis]|uniref:Uncharacterized protein n=1 Tax=Bradymonas sediminis TaxID=1548548 RepID=A0A2Z4FHH8_9DELT|nr:tetratricopeptide repeat protein [Bradymonas sediminis]AWV88174.1 hypothetical protein DN745_02005 [Bradymonas sediminis]TDP77297.1 lipopolysaccharide biosynthesis regulator YciM [Bradymonas sediminis]